MTLSEELEAPLSAFWKPQVVIYHRDCFDGMAAAWAVWRHHMDDDITFVGADYGDPPPDVTDKNVLIVDFSYKRDVLKKMGETATTVIVLDHHASAEHELMATYHTPHARSVEEFVAYVLNELPTTNVFAYFDKTKSGAGLAWDFCAGTDAPLLIEMIQDRDLWLFEFPETRAFGVWLSTEEMSLINYDTIANRIGYYGENPESRAAIFAEAETMYRLFTKNVADFASHAQWYEIAGHRVIGVNCPLEYRSEVGNYLAEKYPDSPFSATFHCTHKGIKWSLRSLKDKFDVSEVAVRYGGGGHREAASFNSKGDLSLWYVQV